jgi:hypothetical protein
MTPRERYLLETAASVGLLVAPRAIPRKTSLTPKRKLAVLAGARHAAVLEGAFVETVLRRPIDRVLRRAFVDERVHSACTSASADAGQDIRRRVAGPRDRRWRKGFPDLDGVACRSRYDNGEVCFGAFDRVNASDLVADGAERFDATPARVDELMSRYSASLDTSAPARLPSLEGFDVVRDVRWLDLLQFAAKLEQIGPPPVTSAVRCASAIVLLSARRDDRMIDLRTVARALGGEVSGDQVRAPGPYHRRRDRSLSVKPSGAARDGFVCHSFVRTCRDYVNSQLGVARFDGRRISRVQQILGCHCGAGPP